MLYFPWALCLVVAVILHHHQQKCIHYKWRTLTVYVITTKLSSTPPPSFFLSSDFSSSGRAVVYSSSTLSPDFLSSGCAVALGLLIGQPGKEKLGITSKLHQATGWSALGNEGRIEPLVGQLPFGSGNNVITRKMKSVLMLRCMQTLLGDPHSRGLGCCDVDTDYGASRCIMC